MTATTYTAEQIEAIGGNHWTKGGHDRVYINYDVWGPLVGLEIDYYKSGNICYATLNGQKLSNSKAGQMSAVTIYWENGALHYTAGLNADRILDAIHAELARRAEQAG